MSLEDGRHVVPLPAFIDDEYAEQHVSPLADYRDADPAHDWDSSGR